MTRTLSALTLTLALTGLTGLAQAQPHEQGDSPAREAAPAPADSLTLEQFRAFLDRDDRILTAAALELEEAFDSKERQTLQSRLALAKPMRPDPIAGTYVLERMWGEKMVLKLTRRTDGKYDVHRVHTGQRGKPISDMMGVGTVRDVRAAGSKTGMRYVDVRYRGHYDGAIGRLESEQGEVVCPRPDTTTSELLINPNTGFMKDTFSPRPESDSNEQIVERGYLEGAVKTRAAGRLRNAWRMRRASVKNHQARVEAAVELKVGALTLANQPVGPYLSELRTRIVQRLIKADLLSPNHAFQAGFLTREQAILAVKLD